MRDADHLGACAFVFCFALGFVFASIDAPERSLPRYVPSQRTWTWGTEEEAREAYPAKATIDWYARSAFGLGAGAIGGALAWLLVAATRRGKSALPQTARAAAWELAALGLGVCVFLFALSAAQGLLRL